MRVLDLAGMTRDINVQINFGQLKKRGISLFDGSFDASQLRTTLSSLGNLDESHYGAGHHLWSELGQRVFTELNVKMIMIARDARDVMLSAAEWMIDDRSGHEPKDILRSLDLKSRAGYVLTGEPPHTTLPHIIPLIELYRNMAKWRDYPNIHVTTFERLVGDRGGGSAIEQRHEIEAICDYVGRPGADIDSIADQIWGTSHTFRQGIAGGWRGYQDNFPHADDRFEEMRGIVDRLQTGGGIVGTLHWL